MKRLLVIISAFLIAMIISCNEDEVVELKYPNQILAGQADSIGIFYTDKEPNDTLTISYPDKGDSVFIDMNKDGTDDFQLMSDGFQSAGTQVSNHKIIPLGENEIVVYQDALKRKLAYNILPGETIDANSSWINEPCYLYGYSYNMYSGPVNWGLFGGSEGKFIGVKIIVNGNELYGWIRVKALDWKLILFDYAGTVGYK